MLHSLSQTNKTEQQLYSIHVYIATSIEMHVVIECIYYSERAKEWKRSFFLIRKFKLFLFISMNHKNLRFLWEVTSNFFISV